MSRQGGFKTAHENGGPKIQVISCPWHRFEVDHPSGAAPLCGVTADDVSLGRVLPLADLITWLALAVGELWTVVNQIVTFEPVAEERDDE